MAKYLIISLRPKQWVKNVIVFAGLFFAEDILVFEKILWGIFAFVMFSMVSSGGYLINDVMDREKDALHPRKKNRPIAAGKVNTTTAFIVAFFLVAASIILSVYNSWVFAAIIAIYFVMTLTYSLILKRIVILDVLIIASGFVLRTIGGTVAVSEEVSSWLVICTIFLSLFLALNKRRTEFAVLGENAGQVRKTLQRYSFDLLDHMINTATAACLIAYALYTLDSATVAKFGTRNLAFTLPFVIYGLFRYLYLVYNHNIGESPEAAILKDVPILICIFLYVLTVAVIIYT